MCILILFISQFFINKLLYGAPLKIHFNDCTLQILKEHCKDLPCPMICLNTTAMCFIAGCSDNRNPWQEQFCKICCHTTAYPDGFCTTYFMASGLWKAIFSLTVTIVAIFKNPILIDGNEQEINLSQSTLLDTSKGYNRKICLVLRYFDGNRVTSAESQVHN